MIIAQNMPRRAPMRARITGAMNTPMIEDAPAPRSSRPIWMLSTPSVTLMAGTRAAHVAIDRPLARKIAKTAVRQRTSCDRVSSSSMPPL